MGGMGIAAIIRRTVDLCVDKRTVMSFSPIPSLPSLRAEEGIKEMFLPQVTMLIFAWNWPSVYPSVISDTFRPPFLTYTLILLLVYPLLCYFNRPISSYANFCKRDLLLLLMLSGPSISGIYNVCTAFQWQNATQRVFSGHYKTCTVLQRLCDVHERLHSNSNSQSFKKQ